MRKVFSILLICLVAACSRTEIPDLLPLPKDAVFSGEWLPAAEPEVRMVDSIPGVRLNPEEAYHLTVGPEGLVIEAVTELGVLNARKTLAQLEKDGKYPSCEITDWPSFRIRGWLMDCGRTYISVDELKRQIDAFSRFKLNVFHWHLTENQAYRLESRKYPVLNAPETMTRQKGMFYTAEEARELAEYCRERGVCLIPELDIPGHSAWFDRAFGFGMQSEEGKTIVKELIREFCEIFADAPYIHLGSDETAFDDPSFMPEMVSFSRSLGKKVMAWNPGWTFAPGEVDVLQLWSYRGKAVPGIPAIDCRFHYINHFDTYGDIVGLHTSRIYDAEEGSGDIAGAMVALWNDRYVVPEDQIAAQNNLYVSAIALADRAWRGGGYQYFDGFGVTLPPEGPAREDFADFERRMLSCAADLPLNYSRQSDIRWQVSEVFPNGGATDTVFAPEKGDYDWSGCGTALGSGIYLRHTWGTLVPAYIKDPEPNSTVYARTLIHSDSERDALLWFETQNYSRSEKDLPPPQGEWDWRHSRIWLNGSPLEPPVWTEDKGRSDPEAPLGNENCIGRDPMTVRLERGDNEILVKLPVGEFSTPETRLVKWMFTCVVK